MLGDPVNRFDPRGLQSQFGPILPTPESVDAWIEGVTGCSTAHYNRNLNQAGLCPFHLNEVNDGEVCGESDFELYREMDPTSSGGFHPGGAYDVRGSVGGPMEGVQCVYDQFGDLVQTTEGAGTWDYAPPGASVMSHVWLDVLPWAICGSGPPFTEPM